MNLSTPENTKLADDFGERLSAIIQSIRSAPDEVRSAAAAMLFGSGITGLVGQGVPLDTMLKEAADHYALVVKMTAEEKKEAGK